MMTQHDHSTYVEGCFRCDLSHDEVCRCGNPEQCYTDQLLADRDAGWREVERLRKRTHEIQEAADKRYSELIQRTEKPLEYWRSALALADKYMAEPGVVWHSAVTRAKAADLFMQIDGLRAALAEVMVPIEVLTAPGEDAWELAPEVRGELMTARTLGRAALGFEPPVSTTPPEPERHAEHCVDCWVILPSGRPRNIRARPLACRQCSGVPTHCLLSESVWLG